MAARVEQNLIGHDNQTVSRQQGQRLAESFVHGGQTPSEIGIVKGGHVVMHQRSAVHQFQSDRSRIGQLGRIVTTGRGHSQAQLGADSGTARKDSMVH
jgi:hypothetical protein